MSNRMVSPKAQEALALLRDLIALPSVSRDEQRAADRLQASLEQYGLATQRHGHNVWTIAPGYRDDRPTLLLNAHLDTVKPVSGWTHDPFTPALEPDGRLYGLGSNDDGASLVSLLQAFLHLSARPQAYNLVYLASAEEEVSGRGGIESVLPMLPPVSFALVGEPTGMQPATAEKGLMVIDATALGRSGHAARDEGDNALYHALDDIQLLRQLRLPRVSPLLGPVKTTVTQIQAGTQHNVVPDRCTFVIDVRSNELYSNLDLLHELQARLHSQLQPRSTRLSSSACPMDHPLVRRAIALGRTPFGSPTLSDQALMPFPSMKMGPGQSSRSHTADEYILPQEIDEAIDLYIRLLDGADIETGA